MAKTPRGHVRRIPKGRRVGIRREEYNHLVDILNERGEILNRLLQDQQIQFQRIAQLQAELDRVKYALAQLKSQR
jgi:hypothetical protein